MKFPVIETVLVFKDGNTVIRSLVKLSKNSRKVRTEMPSSCVHGTCWITCERARIISLKSVESDKVHEHTSKVSSIRELLLGNIGKEVSLLCDINKLEKNLVGKVKEVSDNFTVLEIEPPNGRKSEVFVPIKKIELVEGEGLSRNFQEQEKIREIEIEYETDVDDVGMVYSILKNMSWAPSYLLTLDTEKRMACLKMQSTIVNDAQNFFAKEFICAAGNPKFSYQHVDDPFVTTGLSHSDFLRSMGAGVVTYSHGGGRTRQTARRSTGGRAPRRQLATRAARGSTYYAQQQQVSDDDGSSSSQNNSNKGTATDYYYYQFDNISVEKGQRVLLPVFSQEMKYEDMYKCKLQRSVSGDPLLVTHVVKLTNDSPVIWTTAPVCIRSDKQLFAGQSTVHFTTPGIDTTIDIADALSIRVNYEETSHVNTEKYKDMQGIKYVESIQKCCANVTNFQDKDITIVFHTDFEGSYVEMEKSGESSYEKPTKNIKVLNHGFRASNLMNVHLEWEIKVKMGETKDFEFSYTKWVEFRGSVF